MLLRRTRIIIIRSTAITNHLLIIWIWLLRRPGSPCIGILSIQHSSIILLMMRWSRATRLLFLTAWRRLLVGKRLMWCMPNVIVWIRASIIASSSDNLLALTIRSWCVWMLVLDMTPCALMVPMGRWAWVSAWTAVAGGLIWWLMKDTSHGHCDECLLLLILLAIVCLRWWLQLHHSL